MKNKIITLSAWIAAHITLIVVLVTVVALFLPSSFNWISTSAITPMLGVVMFGMGLTLRPSDFKPVLQHPKDILIGELAQFLIMPSLAWLLCKLLALPDGVGLCYMVALGYPTHVSKLVEMQDGSVKYYLDENRGYCVPKRSMDEVLLKTL